MSTTATDLDLTKGSKIRQWRMFKDGATRYVVASGGGAVIISLLLIFVYLVWVVLPIFAPADAEWLASYDIPGNKQAQTLHLAVEEQNEIASRFSNDGKITFFNTADGSVRNEFSVPSDANISAFSSGFENSQTVLYGFDDGSALFVKHKYKITYPNDQRHIDPFVTFPAGETPLSIDETGGAIQLITGQTGEEEATIVAKLASGDLLVTNMIKEESFMDDELTWETEQGTLDAKGNVIALELIDDQSGLYTLNDSNELAFYDLRNRTSPQLVDSIALNDFNISADALALITGGISAMVTDENGSVHQFFLARNENGNFKLRHIRQFEHDVAVTAFAAEHARKGFMVGDKNGNIGVYHTTAQRHLFTEKASDVAIEKTTFSPRASAGLMLDADQKVHLWKFHNEYPEVSTSALWGEVWYEGYEDPKYTWQSSSASNDFEPKFSLVPLSLGTLKAAFYALLFAIPLAILGAAYTAYFMTPSMRKYVKPTIEIMEALPTVILGFLAGLWLAPFMEKNLPGFITMLVLLPVGTILASYGYTRLPKALRNNIAEGWQAALLIPVVFGIGWLSFHLSPTIEAIFFGGDMRNYLTNDLGIPFDQRNSLVVGIAMGFAVIPTIFSIAEDAVFSVPKHLTFGSLALGATPWQTLTRVVLLTASPGIFSAVMIGLGRAVGETMIVLMATGNTPVMDMSIFQGMRTLSANIAVEMPESELGSSHYRILFLAALVLFVFTFFFNTIAELVRQRLRKKYSSL